MWNIRSTRRMELAGSAESHLTQWNVDWIFVRHLPLRKPLIITETACSMIDTFPILPFCMVRVRLGQVDTA